MLDGLIQLVRDLWEYIWPFVYVRPYQRAVRFTALLHRFKWTWHRKKLWLELRVLEPEMITQTLEPGLRFKFWVLEQIEVSNVNLDYIDLTLQRATTADDKKITFDANCGFIIEDVKKYWLGVENPDNNLGKIMANHLAKRMREKEYEWLRQNMKELESSLKTTLSTRTKETGIRIVDVGITNFVEAPIYSIMGLGQDFANSL
jgi:regulator of protease activity HflC (stomatin/prohibitin superfamily)